MYYKEIDEDAEIEKLIAEGLLTLQQQEYLMTGRCYDMGFVALHGFEPVINDLKHPLIYDLMKKGIVTSQEIIDRKVPGLGPFFNLLSVPEIKYLVENSFITVKEVIWASESYYDYFSLKKELIEVAKIIDFKNDKIAQLRFIKSRENIAFSHLVECLYSCSREAKEFAFTPEVEKINRQREIKRYIEQILHLRSLPLLSRIQKAIEEMLPEIVEKNSKEIQIQIYEWINKESIRAYLYNTASVFAAALKTSPHFSSFTQIGTPLLQEIIVDSVDVSGKFSKLDKMAIIKKCYDDMSENSRHHP